MTKWLNWAMFSLGIWIIASPWILGYWRITPALWNQVVIGVIITLLSLWGIVGIEEEDDINS